VSGVSIVYNVVLRTGGTIMEGEYWGKVKGFDEYLISKDGHIKKVSSGDTCKDRRDRNGYRIIALRSNDGKFIQKKVHRLVAEAFLDDFDHSLQVNHLNRVKSDNRLSNLEMSTRHANMKHAKEILKVKFQRGGSANSSFKGWILAVSVEHGGKIFFEGKQAIIDAGFNPNCVYDCISGRQRSHKGYEWRRYESNPITNARWERKFKG